MVKDYVSYLNKSITQSVEITNDEKASDNMNHYL